MKFPKNKLDFLNATAKVAAEDERMRDLIEKEPLILLPLSMYSCILADTFYPEDEDKNTDEFKLDDHFKVKDTYFHIFYRKDDIRLIISKENNIVADELFNNKVAALIAIIRYVEQCM